MDPLTSRRIPRLGLRAWCALARDVVIVVFLAVLIAASVVEVVSAERGPSAGSSRVASVEV